MPRHNHQYSEVPIDIVVPWVDGSDPDWLVEFNKYKKLEIDSNIDSSDTENTPNQSVTVHSSSEEQPAEFDAGEERYRDWDLLPYWFRAIEQNAPWVRKVFFVTWGHIPKWLNTDHPKIQIVRHDDYIPKQYLPTFTSICIELNLFRIPDLSEHFIYFNDDVYLTQQTCPEDFFVDGKPRDAAILGIIKQNNLQNFMPYTELNMLGIINTEFSKPEVIHKNRRKWFSLKYRKALLKNLLLAKWSSVFTGFYNFHSCQPLKKSTCREVWDKYGYILDKVCHHRFRTRNDINQYLFRYWQICKGDFEPSAVKSDYFTIGQISVEKAREVLNDKSYNTVCVNDDDPEEMNFAYEQQQMRALFEEKFRQKSSFER